MPNLLLIVCCVFLNQSILRQKIHFLIYKEEASKNNLLFLIIPNPLVSEAALKPSILSHSLFLQKTINLSYYINLHNKKKIIYPTPSYLTYPSQISYAKIFLMKKL